MRLYNLHSTMVLLKLISLYDDNELISNLHSTMVLLKFTKRTKY